VVQSPVCPPVSPAADTSDWGRVSVYTD
jgi:hypothetical protein